MNCFAALCGPLPPSFLDLRAHVKQDDSLRRLTTNGMTTHGPGTVAYHPDEHGLYKNRVVGLLERWKSFSSAAHRSSGTVQQPIKLVMNSVLMFKNLSDAFSFSPYSSSSPDYFLRVSLF